MLELFWRLFLRSFQYRRSESREFQCALCVEDVDDFVPGHSASRGHCKLLGNRQLASTTVRAPSLYRSN